MFRVMCLVVMLVGNAADAISTYFAAKALGIQGESNPVLRGLMNAIGIVPTLIIKLAVFSWLALALYSRPYYWASLFVGIPYLLAAYNNVAKVMSQKRSEALGNIENGRRYHD